MNWSINIKQLQISGLLRITILPFLRKYAIYVLFLIPVSVAVALSLSFIPAEKADDAKPENQAIALNHTDESPTSIDMGINSPVNLQASLSDETSESAFSVIETPLENSDSQLTQLIRQPVLQVFEELPESNPNAIESEISEYVIQDQAVPLQQVAIVDRKSVEGHDQPVSANNPPPEMPLVDSALTNAASQLAESIHEPILRDSEDSPESNPNTVESGISEYVPRDQAVPPQQVAMVDRKSVEGHDQPVSANNPPHIAPAADSAPTNSVSQLTESIRDPVLRVSKDLPESSQSTVAEENSEYFVQDQEAAPPQVVMFNRKSIQGHDQPVSTNILPPETPPVDSVPDFSDSELTESILEPVIQASEDSPESSQITVVEKISEHLKRDQEVTPQKVAMVNRKSVEGHDQPVSANILPPETPPVDSMPDYSDSQSTESILEPVNQDSEDSTDSNQDTVAEVISEHTIASQEAPAQKVAMVDRESIEESDQTAQEIDLHLETPPVDAALNLPEDFELDWSTTVFRRNDTLSKVLQRNGIKLKTMYQLLDIPGTGMLKVVYPNDQLTIARGGGGELVGIEFRREKKGVLMFVFTDDDIRLVDSAVAKRAGSLQNIFDGQHRVVMQKKQESFIQTVATIKEQELIWHEVTVRKGDTLSRIFGRIGISGSLEVALAPSGNWLSSGLMPKQEIRIATRTDNTFAMIEVFDFKSEKIRMVVADGEDYAVGYRKMQPEIREYQACATVTSNLYNAAKAAKIPVAAVDEFADIFASRIDFSRQLQKGDRYCMIYERKFVKERIVGRVGIVAASLEQKNHSTQTFRVTDKIGDTRYYDQYGENMLGHFLRAPVKSARVTSVFSNNRFHPVLKKYRKHQGVDYGAAKNTPIISTADGVVSRRANNPSGYGKVIVIQHGSKYQTLYAHMNRFAKNTSTGSYVKRGQVIGYVGSSGQSTGNHVHYEFRVNGVHRDPLNYPMPKGKPVPEELREEFDRKIATLLPRLRGIDQTKVVSISPDIQE